MISTQSAEETTQLYDEGFLTQSESTIKIMQRFGVVDVSSEFPGLSDEWKRMLFETVRDAPKSDLEWSRFRIFAAGGYVNDSKESWGEMWQDEAVAYRKGVEALRSFLENSQ